jgi:hypothetical protein
MPSMFLFEQEGEMKHPFRVGEKYRNRKGEYEVVKLEEPKMMIRYADGQVFTADIGAQAQIWENIQAEDRLPPRPPEPPVPPRGRDSEGKDFHGLQEPDFKKGVGGTSWRSRPSLGGLLAKTMSAATGRSFESYAIYRRAEVHIAQPVQYRERVKSEEGKNSSRGTKGEKDKSKEKERLRKAKFFFSLDAEQASFGFYIEKDERPMDETWRWLRFISILKTNRELQQKLQAAMHHLHLHWDVYVWKDGGLIAQVEPAQESLQWEWRNQNKAEV